MKSFWCYLQIAVLLGFPFFSSYQRITVPQVQKDPWFKKGYKPPVFDEKCQVTLDDVHAAFGDSKVN